VRKRGEIIATPNPSVRKKANHLEFRGVRKTAALRGRVLYKQPGGGDGLYVKGGQAESLFLGVPEKKR